MLLRALHAELHRIRRFARHRNPSSDFYQFQLKLLAIVIGAERRIRLRRREIERHRARLGSQVSPRLTKSEAQAIKIVIQRRKQLIDDARWTIQMARTLATSLALCLYTKWDVRLMADQEHAGFISGKKGGRVERRVLRRLALERRVPAILNDLTDCFRVGDITVPGVTEDGQNLIPWTIEVKSSGTMNERTSRQAARSEKLRNYLRTDEWQNFGGEGRTRRRVKLVRAERHHRRKLNNLLRQATSGGSVKLRVERGVYYCAVRDLDDFAPMVRRMSVPDYFVIPLFGDTLQPQYEPLAWNIRDSAHWWAVVTGRLHIVVLVDRRVIVSSFKKMGFDIEWCDGLSNFGAGWRVTSSDYPERSFDVAYHFFARVGTEFLQLKWFTELVTTRFAQVTSNDGESRSS